MPARRSLDGTATGDTPSLPLTPPLCRQRRCRRALQHALKLVGNVRWCASIQVQPGPYLQVDEREQPVRAVDAVVLVRADQITNRCEMEQPATLDLRFREQAAHERCQLAFQPCAHRRAETALLALEY